MKKEITLLEALEKLKQYWNNETPLSGPQGLKIVSIIEMSLKDYVPFEQGLKSGELIIVRTNDELEHYKKIKALEIIKELFDFDDKEFYPFKYKTLKNISQEKLDLLKEVLS